MSESDRPSRRAHDGLWDALRELVFWLGRRLAWLIQFLAVFAAASAVWLGSMTWRSSQARADAERRLAATQEGFEIVNFHDSMITVMNDITAGLEMADGAIRDSEWDRAGGELGSARSNWNAMRIRCEVGAESAEPDAMRRVRDLLCDSHTLLATHLALEDTVIARRRYFDAEQQDSWASIADSLDRNRDTLNRLVDSVRAGEDSIR